MDLGSEPESACTEKSDADDSVGYLWPNERQWPNSEERPENSGNGQRIVTRRYLTRVLSFE